MDENAKNGKTAVKPSSKNGWECQKR